MNKVAANGKMKLNVPSNLRRKILLVDDDPADLRFYRLILEHEGYKVRTSESFAEGIRALEQEPFDMVVVGQGSQGFEGRSVLERARRLDPRTPVAVMARRADPCSYVEAMSFGAVDYREKPVDPDEFVSVIEAHLTTKSGVNPA